MMPMRITTLGEGRAVLASPVVDPVSGIHNSVVCESGQLLRANDGDSLGFRIVSDGGVDLIAAK